MPIRTLVALLCLFLLGCAGGPPSAPATVQPIGRSILVRPFVSSPISVQALVPNKTIDDIFYLAVVPTIDPGDGQYHVISKATGEPLSTADSLEWYWEEVVYVDQRMPWIRFDQTIRISGLRAFGRYRITALAYGRDGHIISKVGAPSSVDLTLSNDDMTTVETALPVQLIDPVRVSHLNAQTRYVMEIEPQVVDDGPAPASQSLEIQVGQDDVLPDREVTIAIPAL